jgi:cell division transport system permease protein
VTVGVFFIREALRSLRHHRGIALTAIVSLTAVLTLSGILLLLTHNARIAMNVIGDRREMIVYLRDDVTASQRDLLIGRISDLYGAVTYVNKEQAWQEFVRQVGDASLLESVGDNPLPSSLRIKLKPELLVPEEMDSTAARISRFPEVEDVRYGQEWARRLWEVGELLTRVTIVVLGLVGLAIVLVLYNTIRLTVLARRQQVETMVRLGATDRFIATPFVIEALIEALVASGFALGSMYAIQVGVASRLVGGLQFLPWQGTLIYLGSVILLAWLATMLALARVMRAIGP